MNSEYKERVNRTIRFIEDNINQKLSLSDVAKVSYFSEFHFHRIFRAIVGETVNDYIARRRIEKAINMLVFKPKTSITEIALACGFSSNANFSKAVKIHFGFTPSEIRNPQKIKDSKIGKVFSKYGKDFNPVDLYPNHITNNVIFIGDTNMNVEIKDLEEQQVCTLPSEAGYQPEAIFNAWDRLIQWAIANGIQTNTQQRFAFCFDNPTVTPIDKCRYEASIVIDETVQVKSPFSLSKIPKGKYAVLYFKGKPEDTIKAQLGIYSDWFPQSGFEPDNFPMLEHYLNDVRQDGYIEMEILVKLKKL
ncbi:AraC family transcriptional regulator [Tolumonas lignilytica]|jgi:DNA gyrase inhibitor|uniref:AraC family transcriptional regulator n=1 Tax=Tolumonas lignilytica TaxID=1283284 RepID=UPI0004656981|nr:GyrI-like domain-containing protein [Tolumonas lignilytica]